LALFSAAGVLFKSDLETFLSSFDFTFLLVNQLRRFTTKTEKEPKLRHLTHSLFSSFFLRKKQVVLFSVAWSFVRVPCLSDQAEGFVLDFSYLCFYSSCSLPMRLQTTAQEL